MPSHSYVELLAAKGIDPRQAYWGPRAGELTDEERARHLLAINWQIERGHCNRVRVIDAEIIEKRYMIPTKKTTYRINFSIIPDLLLDKIDKLVADIRKFRDRILGIKNPYLT